MSPSRRLFLVTWLAGWAALYQAWTVHAAAPAVQAELGALLALGLLEQLTPVADPDHDSVGKTLEAARAPRLARRADRLDADF